MNNQGENNKKKFLLKILKLGYKSKKIKYQYYQKN